MQSWSNDHIYLKRVVFARRDRLVSPQTFEPPNQRENWVWKDVPGRPTHIKRQQPIATLIARTDRLSLHQAFRVMV